MKTLAGITLAVCALSVVHTALSMLAPDRYRREMRAIVALIAVAALAHVISGADFSYDDFDFGDISGSGTFLSRDDLIKKELEDKISDYISSLLSERGIVPKKISVTATIDGQRRISITKASLTLDQTYREEEPKISSLIRENVADIPIDYFYGDG